MINISKSKKNITLIIILLFAGAVLFLFEQQKYSGIASKFMANEDMPDLLSSQFSGVDVPQRDADIVGMIEDINGNEITVLEFNQLNMPEVSLVGESTQTKKNNSNENAISLGQNAGGMMAGPSGMGGFGRSSRSSSGNRSSSDTATSNNRQAIMAGLKAVSIGKQTIAVPIGIPIFQDAAGGKNGTSRVDVKNESKSFTELTSDTMVRLWIKRIEDGKESAEFVGIIGKVNMNNSNN